MITKRLSLLINQIFHDPGVHSSIPSNINNFDISAVVYNLEKLIHIGLLNFNRFLLKFDVDRFLLESTILPCNFERSEFIDQHQKYSD